MKAIIPVLALMAFSACSCDRAGDCRGRAAEPAAGARSLKELPREQLRVFLKGYAGDWRGDSDKSRGVPPPPIEKAYPAGASLIDLVKPADIKLGNVPLAQVINQRRSRRNYTGDSLTNEELSFLLWSTQGLSKVEKDSEGRVINQYRTVPSGGARHPFETYLVINRVQGIKPGLYRYLVVEHKLLPLREDGGLEKAILEACYGQQQAGEAAVVFAWSAVTRRTEWAYGYIGYKLIALDAGHVCQNLYLAAEAIGGGACAIMGYDQERMDAMLGLDGAEEFTFYLATVGKIEAGK